MKKLNFIRTVLILLTTNISFGQQAVQDSLKIVYQKSTNDSIRAINLMNYIEYLQGSEKAEKLTLMKNLVTKKINTSKNKSTNNFYKSMLLNTLQYELFVEIEKGNYSNSILDKYKQCLKISQELNDPSSTAMTFNNIGYFYQLKGDLKLAVKYYQDALKIIRKNNIIDGLAPTLNNSAGIYDANGDVDLALKYYKMCLTPHTLKNNISSVVTLYINIGNIYSKGKNVKLGIDYLNKAVKIAQQNNFTNKQVVALNNLGLVQIKNKEFTQALINAENALVLSKKASFKVGEATSMIRLSEAYRNVNKLKQSILFGENAFTIGKELKNPELLSQISNQLMLSYKASNDYKKAFLMNEIYTANIDSIENEKTQKAIIQSQVQYEFDTKAIKDSLKIAGEKKIAKIQLDKQKNQKMFLFVILILILLILFFLYNRFKLTSKQKSEIEGKNQIIQKSLSEKEVLLKEIHHRVKNNLQVISSLIGLQSAKIEDEKLKSIFAESKNKINTISLIHQKLYQNENLAEIDMNDYFDSLYAAIVSMFDVSKKQVHFDLQTHDLKFDIDTSVPLGLIFNELITNSLKYAFEENKNPEIKTALTKIDDKKYQLLISDNGKGFDEADKNKNSLGLNLVKMLATQLNGVYTTNNQMGSVNTIIFEDTNQRKLSE